MNPCIVKENEKQVFARLGRSREESRGKKENAQYASEECFRCVECLCHSFNILAKLEYQAIIRNQKHSDTY
jgi:hypothetical protein